MQSLKLLTEKEFFEAIKNGSVQPWIIDGIETDCGLHLLIRITCQKFGLVHPGEYPIADWAEGLRGMEKYGAWYKRIGEQITKENWENTPCSACPLSKGYETFNIGASVCSLMNGSSHHGPKCFIIDEKYYSLERVQGIIRSKWGQGAVDKFEAHRQKLIL